MVPFTYRCPRTGQQVQGWAIDALAEGELYEPVTCTACGRVHLVNRKSGKVLGLRNEIERLQRRVVSSGSLAIFTAIRRASSLLSSLAASAR
jgi:hypothetical protein